ncbi:MAG: type II/IV secretion system protein [Candidatus Marinimicrobia bacterium]|nr:type II/IV secretion system protein [Candidatus Neomarinimicrobiota bacterium]
MTKEISSSTPENTALIAASNSQFPSKEVLYTRFAIEFVDLKTVYSFDNSIAIKMTEELCEYHRVVPLETTADGQLMLAMADPFDMVAQQIVSVKTGYTIKALKCSDDDISFALGRIYKNDTSFEETLQELIEVDDDSEEIEAPEVSIDILRSEASDAPAVVFVNSLLVQAIQERASDIHIEPQETELRIRLRIDGILKELQAASKKLQGGVVARIKILSSMDIAEQRIPQDGRIKFKIMGRSVDVRVSTVPGIYGEKIVMRILDKGSTSLNINDLGIKPDQLDRLKEIANAAHGMILVTGPTGSGKTTTLYSILNYVNSPSLNIVTAEDPVEYRLPGITQIQMKPKVGLTFASTLRSFLRQDPDIIMVGEMRDLETAEIGVKAALTGHLVLSTLHTNDAISTITRLVNMGVDRYLITSSVSLIVSQRLVRRLCLNCKTSYEPSKSLTNSFARLEIDLTDNEYYTGKGCKQCSGSGYWGRAAIHEFLFITEELKELIVTNGTEKEMREVAEKSGMVSLLNSGHQKAVRGITSLEEVLRVN